jgi:hypothetical protein
MKKVDMSSEAVARRLRQASDLRDLGIALMRAKRRADDKAHHAPAHKDKTERQT